MDSTVKILKEKLKALGAKTSGKKEDLLRRLKLWEEENLARTLITPVSVPPTAQCDYPKEDTIPLLACDRKDLEGISINSINEWFVARQATASLKKGRQLFHEKFLKCTETFKMTNMIYIKSICSAQTSKNVDYVVQTLLHETDIIQASCECAAGAGLNAACKHLAALFYCIEHYQGCGIVHEAISRTNTAQQWKMPPKGKKPDHMTSFEMGKGGKPDLTKESVITMDILKNMMLQNNVDSPLLINRNCNLNAYVMDHDYFDDQLSLNYVSRVNAVSDKEIVSIEKKTRKQFQSKLWHSARKSRITASVTKSMVTAVKTGSFTANPAKLQINNKAINNEATKWGRENEIKAISEYQKLTGNVIQACGILIYDKNNNFAASPDGITENRDCLIEVKCPYSLRNASSKDAKFFTKSGSSLELNRKHSYYYQIQFQMLIWKIKRCDFVVWTPRDITIQNIKFDEDFCKEMTEHLKIYFRNVFAPMYVQMHSN